LGNFSRTPVRLVAIELFKDPIKENE